MTKMRLSDYLDGLRSAVTADALETALQAPFTHPFHGRTWSAICAVRIQRGLEICDTHPLGRFVPRLGKRHALTVCGETYKVGYGQNSTGVRYCWHYAEQFATGVLRSNGLSRRAACSVWGQFGQYPHRCLKTLERAMAGDLPDPVFDTMIFSYESCNPVRITCEQNDKDTIDRRATRPCPCGGTLFDWGCGWTGYANFINWHCNECPKVFTEYLSEGRLEQIRSEGLRDRAVGH